MKTIQVFDPALCCSSGVCGTDVDQNLVDFSADIAWAKQQGAQIERVNLAQQPMAFADNAAVKDLLQQHGESALPVVLVDGQVSLSGSYPSRDVLAAWLGLRDLQPAAPTAKAQAGCCGARPADAAKSATKCC